MKFFIPGIDDNAAAEQVHSAIRKHLTDVVGAQLDERRVFKLSHVHDAKELTAEVGQRHPVSHKATETVFAILHDPVNKLYHICTPNRGVHRGGSILAGEDSVTAVKDFDPEK